MTSENKQSNNGRLRGAIVLGTAMILTACSASESRSPQPIATGVPALVADARLPPQIQGCRACHGANLKGSNNSGNWAPDLTATGELSAWNEEQFIRALRTGERPFGQRALDPDKMPWPAFREMTDDELKALWAYLQQQTAHQEQESAPTVNASPVGDSAPARTNSGASPTYGQAVMIEISSTGDQLLFNKTQLSAQAGSKITLKLTNNASPGSGMMHDWVLVKPGTGEMVAADGIAAGDANGWVKPGDANVLAATKVSAPGETVEVTFNAPPAGMYPILCTIPRHSAMMRGTLTIK